jgi:peptide/nickel transport system permease protein
VTSRRYVNPNPFGLGEADVAAGISPPSFWSRLKSRRLAFAAFLFLAVSYALLPFIEIIAPYDSEARDSERVYAPPQTIRFFHDGQFLGPFVYGYTSRVDTNTFKREFSLDREKPQRLQFLCQGSEYRLFGMFPASMRLVCPAKNGTVYLLGTDRLGRDVLSRMLYGGRVSLTIGLIGVAISLMLGVMFGLLAGYLGGWVDNAIQRLIELLRSLPELPLWMALAAALPVNWSPLWVFAGITVILGLLDWPGLARAVRSRVLSLREEEFTVAAQLMGASPWRIMYRHMLPNFTSHLFASASLAIPSMILGETALSFLGLGLRPPVTSWGVMLNDAQNLAVLEVYPWLLAPLLPVVGIVLAFNLLGDGLRDAADPYSR